MNEASYNYYWSKVEPARSCLLSMQSVVLAMDGHISETLKWGLPCFMYKNKMFCFFHVDKTTDEPYILFQEGDLLEHPALEKGDRKKMKIYRIDPNKDLPIETIHLLINKALSLYREGIIKTKEK